LQVAAVLKLEGEDILIGGLSVNARGLFRLVHHKAEGGGREEEARPMVSVGLASSSYPFLPLPPFLPPSLPPTLSYRKALWAHIR
jgi:hypothetical protein